ncbi:uncharacterized protein F5147DRAFT_774815 [Suillus discolor]|uniref:Uncharacterized protein n=1 Tax=Suillus discolor TaxID=1912936 RepID=A0A9P7JT69_9AGAM|nr:uncharacterized protein F5147DRAFT_774815 [Suillus discolor]KAG2106530.1 hypothetical protein F5147DRAFT_774815 [Suillus discolor]
MTYMCLVRMKPGRDERTYNNPLMDCSSMGEYLDVLSAHDRLGDGNGLKAVHFQTEGDHRSLDLGFPASDDDRITDTRNHPQPDILDMQFPTMSDDEQSHDEMLELGFPPESDVEDVLDLGFDIDVSDSAGNTDGALEMGFDIDVSDPAGHTDGALEMGFDTNDIMPDDNPLEMGFDVDPAQFDPDQSFAVIRPDPIGFVIQRAVGDLRIAMHRLDMDRASNAMSPDEAIARQQVLDSTQELLLACQLISISRLAT